MLFNSFEFIFLFLPVVVTFYFFINKRGSFEQAKVWLVLSSLFFYGYWNPIYLPLILGSIIFNYFIAGYLQRCFGATDKNYAKSLFLFGTTVNVVLLFSFKYMDFFIFNVNYIFSSNYGYLNIILPLAISFFTLQQITYLVDSYEGEVKERNFLNYMLYVSFFPQLIAGPIVHHKEVMPQFKDDATKIINFENIGKGLFIFAIGLFKKIFVADTFSYYATNGHDFSKDLNILESWITSFAYSMQLYFDFSGYTDMAIGAALILNIKLPLNFNSPYKSASIIDFWQRWHMTLTHFITTYVYTPILKSFSVLNFRNAMIATFLAMLIAGLWHGASWTFVMFGALHGLAIVINHNWMKRGKRLSEPFAIMLTFLFVNFAWVFFRATSWDNALKIINGMISFSTYEKIKIKWNEGLSSIFESKILGLESVDADVYLIVMFILAIALLRSKNSYEIMNEKLKFSFSWLLYTLGIYVFCLYHLSKPSEFLYFNF